MIGTSVFPNLCCIHSLKDLTVIASGAKQSHNYLQIRRLLRQKTPRNDMLTINY